MSTADSHAVLRHDVERSADTLRGWALDEDLKSRVLSEPTWAAMAGRVARRYTAGDDVASALDAARAVAARGHRVSVEYVGESVRDAAVARAEAAVFVDLATALKAARVASTVSFDLSHIGLLVDPDLAADHVQQIATAAAPGTVLMISAEGSDRTDAVLDLYDSLADAGLPVGVTLQARLHRTPDDLPRVLAHPGPVRLVKGAFLEDDSTAHRRGTPALTDAYLSLAGSIMEADHALAVATHDPELLTALDAAHGERLRSGNVEVEMLMGLGTDLLDQLLAIGYHTREYVVFGPHWWLYVLNRIAEDPARVITALADLAT
ncbi:proline dehydrogenase family protein [Aquipuribacter sp. SD81]|uniref:proline dehydrogenase family protein n=1 Tax=Aquipuribacter sp. SD81 TaxID=3127703 RepID=UPI003015C2CF